MKVKELKEILNSLSDDLEIVMSSDAEGNNYHYLRNISTEPELVCSGDSYCMQIGYSKLTPELEKLGYSEGDVISNGIRCIVIWP